MTAYLYLARRFCRPPDGQMRGEKDRMSCGEHVTLVKTRARVAQLLQDLQINIEHGHSGRKTLPTQRTLSSLCRALVKRNINVSTSKNIENEIQQCSPSNWLAILVVAEKGREEGREGRER